MANVSEPPPIAKGGWATDQMIAMWMYNLRQLDECMCRLDNTRPKTLFIDPIISFHECIAKNQWYKLNRLYKRMRSQTNMSFLDYDRIVIPCNQKQNHWSLQVIYFKQKVIVYYNSYDTVKVPEYLSMDLVYRFLEFFANLDKRQFQRNLWKSVIAKCSPQV